MANNQNIPDYPPSFRHLKDGDAIKEYRTTRAVD